MSNPQHVHVNQEYDDKPWDLGLGFLYNFRPSQSLLSLSTDSLPGLQGTQSPEELEDDVLFTKGILQPRKKLQCLGWKVGHFSGMLSSKSSEKCAGLNGGKMGLHMD